MLPATDAAPELADVSGADLDRLAEALAVVIRSWWERKEADRVPTGEQEQAPAAEEVSGAA